MSNNSLWIIFFVQRDLLPEPFQSHYALIAIVEVIADLLSICVATFGIYLFYKVQYFHFNLAAIWINAYLIGPFFVVSRLILIIFEFGYLQDTKAAREIVESVSTFRFALFIAIFHFETLIVIERVFALCFVETYEKNPRRYISVIIICSNYLLSAMLAYLIVHTIIHGFFYLAFVCITSNVSYLTFLYLNSAGKRKQKELLEKYRGYSVTHRWQLRQNIDAANQLSVLMVIVNVVICIILPCIFVPAFMLEHDEHRREIYEAAKLLIELLVSLVLGPVYGGVAMAISRHRQWLCSASAPVTPDRIGQANWSTEAYFTRLRETWNA